MPKMKKFPNRVDCTWCTGYHPAGCHNLPRITVRVEGRWVNEELWYCGYCQYYHRHEDTNGLWACPVRRINEEYFPYNERDEYAESDDESEEQEISMTDYDARKRVLQQQIDRATDELAFMEKFEGQDFQHGDVIRWSYTRQDRADGEVTAYGTTLKKRTGDWSYGGSSYSFQQVLEKIMSCKPTKIEIATWTSIEDVQPKEATKKK